MDRKYRMEGISLPVTGRCLKQRKKFTVWKNEKRKERRAGEKVKTRNVDGDAEEQM